MAPTQTLRASALPNFPPSEAEVHWCFEQVRFLQQELPRCDRRPDAHIGNSHNDPPKRGRDIRLYGLPHRLATSSERLNNRWDTSTPTHNSHQYAGPTSSSNVQRLSVTLCTHAAPSRPTQILNYKYQPRVLEILYHNPMEIYFSPLWTGSTPHPHYIWGRMYHSQRGCLQIIQVLCWANIRTQSCCFIFIRNKSKLQWIQSVIGSKHLVLKE